MAELLWLLPVCLVVFAVLLWPTFNIFYISFTNRSLVKTGESWVGLNNYLELLSDSGFLNALENTVIFSASSVFLQMLIGVLLALMLAPKIVGIRVFRVIMLYPYMTPTVVAAAIFKWMFNEVSGILTVILLDLRIWQIPVSVFGSTELAMAGTVLVSVWRFTPFVTILVLSRLFMIPTELYEQADVDGVSTLQKFWYITLPELSGVLGIVLILRSIWMFRNFDIIWLLTQGGPLRSTETIPILTWDYGFQSFQLGLASAAAIILFALILLMAVAYFRAVRK